MAKLMLALISRCPGLFIFDETHFLIATGPTAKAEKTGAKKKTRGEAPLKAQGPRSRRCIEKPRNRQQPLQHRPRPPPATLRENETKDRVGPTRLKKRRPQDKEGEREDGKKLTRTPERREQATP